MQRTQDSQVSSFLFPQLAELKLDPHFDVYPRTHPSGPPPFNATSSSEGNQTDAFVMPQENIIAEAVQPDTSSPTQSSKTSHSSPIAHILHHHLQDAAFSMPMLEVPGPEGAMLVFVYGLLLMSEQHHSTFPTPQHQLKYLLNNYSHFVRNLSRQ